jgi:hypothetical protein
MASRSESLIIMMVLVQGERQLAAPTIISPADLDRRGRGGLVQAAIQ